MTNEQKKTLTGSGTCDELVSVIIAFVLEGVTGRDDTVGSTDADTPSRNCGSELG